MLTIVGIDHIVLRTDKLNEMLAFYCQVLGCTIERQTDKSLGLTQLRAGNALIDIVDVNSELGRAGGNAPSTSENNLDHFCLQLATISEQQLIEHFKQHNISLPNFERRYGAQGYGQSVYLTDPQGNTVELRSTI
ncbi:lactoylglutathione lyase [Thalassotalea insulae]|uniref:Lactoylglutathione lyase n=1 Tax=Thalassotalea insulae TaxID=2056778 RepID=A0ABQ6GWB8_9GAMM|nr:VOC family protein [Thalassotalea insulae]GLX79494.1 lactoylglutathione lyase [Thalassotalea insulae]